MRRVMFGALILIALCVVVGGSAVASDLDGLWMSLTPAGAAQTDFPSGTETVYLVFEYTDFIAEDVRVVVSDYSGTTVFEETQRFSGSGTASVAISHREQAAFPDGLYVTTMYFAGQYMTQAVEWTVGGVDLPATPTPQPLAQLEVEPASLTFEMQQGGPNPSAQRVLVSNSTAPASTWHATARAPWLQLVPEGGLTPALLRISADGTGLPAGTYTDRVTVSADGIAGSPKTVDIRLTVSPPVGSMTLDLPAVASGTGWVVSEEPLANHFDEDEIWAGLQSGLEYLGGLEFDPSAVPGGSDIRAAAVLLPGARWQTQPSDGVWVLELIDGDLAEGWRERGYADVAQVAAKFALAPGYHADNLGAGSESVWYVDSAGLDILESFVGAGDPIVMRLRYEGADLEEAVSEDGLFVWEEAGILRINFRAEGGPTATETPTSAVITPSPTATGTATVEPATPTPTATPGVPPPPPPGGKQPHRIAITALPWLLALVTVFSIISVRRP